VHLVGYLKINLLTMHGNMNVNKREKHMTWRRRVNGYNLTQTILLIGKVTTVVQVVTSAVTADTLPITQTLELFRKTLSTTMWFTYIQT